MVSPWAACDGFTPNLPATVQFSLALRGQQRSIEIESGPRDPTTIRVDEVALQVAHVERAGEHYDFLQEDPRSKEFSASVSRGYLTTPLPGVVAAVAVEAGQVVA